MTSAKYQVACFSDFLAKLSVFKEGTKHLCRWVPEIIH